MENLVSEPNLNHSLSEFQTFLPGQIVLFPLKLSTVENIGDGMDGQLAEAILNELFNQNPRQARINEISAILPKSELYKLSELAQRVDFNGRII